MLIKEYLKELAECRLCEHQCGINRLEQERGVCGITTPVVASATLHPAPPESYTVFLAGCNFKCLNCQNWIISQYPDNAYPQRGFIEPELLARECIENLESPVGRRMRADRIFFSGGEATIHLPYIEKVVQEARRLRPETKINFDTNGFLTEVSIKKVLQFTTSITYDLKAYNDEIHRALTGVSSRPVLRNAEYIGRHASEKLWEFRILVIPGMNEQEIQPLTRFIAGIDSSLPVCFLAFRPNFALEDHIGADGDLMEQCVNVAKRAGLKNVYWSGHTGIPGAFESKDPTVDKYYELEESRRAARYAFKAGCNTHPRQCGACSLNRDCQLKTYLPVRTT